MQRIPCVLMRGGTSKGPFFLAWDLPVAVSERDELLLNLMGSGHELEIDGIGGGSPQTSKVAIVSPSLHPDADVDYLFVQVMVSQRRVDTAPNCGNMLCAVGPFAIEQGLVKATGAQTQVRIRNLNTGTLVNAQVQTPDGKVSYEGDTTIDGVPGSAAPVALTFLDAAGSKTGQL
ncbi:MAG: PrpF domain-containing protein, partial [Pseudomonas protegens]